MTLRGKNIEPGTFHPYELTKWDIFWEGVKEIPLSIRRLFYRQPLEIHKPTVAKLKFFRNEIAPEINSVLYPCCGWDASIAKAFSKNHVTHIDIEAKPIRLFRKKGYLAQQLSIFDYRPDELAGLMILLNPAIGDVEDLQRVIFLVKVYGYIICNNYHDTADILNKYFNLSFNFRGAIVQSRNQEIYFAHQDLDQFWQSIENEEELRNAPFSWYRANLEVIKAIVGKFSNDERFIAPFSTYNDLVQKYQCLCWWAEDHGGIIDDELIEHLPRKKGTADDLFVFQRYR